LALPSATYFPATRFLPPFFLLDGIFSDNNGFVFDATFFLAMTVPFRLLKFRFDIPHYLRIVLCDAFFPRPLPLPPL